MSFKEFVASHTGRHFFDSFREFVSAFKTYVGHLTLHNQILATQFQTEVNAINENTPNMMPCMRCQEACSSSVSVMVGWRGAVSLLCVKCAIEIGVVDDNKAN